MPSTLVIHAHPRPGQSVVIAELCRFFASRDDVEIRSLYELYPDFDIDVAAEQQALTRADLVIWLAPVYWYSVPALMKHWIDQVLAHGWAYGDGACALHGKSVWWATSAGGDTAAYTASGAHGRPFEEFVAPIEHVARFCGMDWLPPFVVHAGHAAGADNRRAIGEDLARRYREIHTAMLAAKASP
ncbi:MAG: NAD(P)H-dependent oxidoreductase [Sulfuritalea sp.]|nr:NAD(P)H-dependent oxidoreductase [Sulfuritalea sp.]